MGLVDYSESDSSGSEAEAPAPAKATTKTPQPGAKKPFQKVVDRSNPGKIVVNLPSVAATTSDTPRENPDEPPAKRARTAGGGRFSGFNSFLPAPKNANKPTGRPSASSRGPGVSLKTSAAPGFSRDADDEGGVSTGMELPPPKQQAQPSIPEDQKAAEDVKIVGKPMMFRPLSVARNSNKKKKIPKTGTSTPAAPASAPNVNTAQNNQDGAAAQPDPAPAPPPKKVSLFSMHTEEASEPSAPSNQGSAYEPMFEAEQSGGDAYGDYPQYGDYAQTGPTPTTAPGTESLDNIADDLNLSAHERRELFGRGGSNLAAKKVVNFNMDREYQHNEKLRAAGEEQIHNPVRAIAGGKHSLKQLVQNVHNQREALEDSFAKGKTNRREASSKYGW